MNSDSDEEVIIIALCAEEEERNRKKENRKWVHNICKKRKTAGEFHTIYVDLLDDETKFFQYFRMNQEKFLELLETLQPELTKKNITFRKAIQPKDRLAVCLRYLATGNSFRSFHFNYRLGESTVRKIVYETCAVMWKKLQPIVMPAPTTDMWKNIENAFSARWNFPNCIGAIDGKHINIEAPPNSGSQFFNYKKTFSIVLMALVDANYRFVVCDVGAYGKNSDGAIFASSSMGKGLYSNKLNIPADKKLPGTDILAPHVIVGDEAFPLHKHIMRPYPGAQATGQDSKRIFNYRLSRARRISENAFRILVQRFRIFQRHIKMYPEHVDTIILATCCLHNFLSEESTLHEIADDEIPNLQPLRRIGGSVTAEAITVREIFRDYFVSQQDSVAWQNEILTTGRRNLSIY